MQFEIIFWKTIVSCVQDYSKNVQTKGKNAFHWRFESLSDSVEQKRLCLALLNSTLYLSKPNASFMLLLSWCFWQNILNPDDIAQNEFHNMSHHFFPPTYCILWFVVVNSIGNSYCIKFYCILKREQRNKKWTEIIRNECNILKFPRN